MTWNLPHTNLIPEIIPQLGLEPIKLVPEVLEVAESNLWMQDSSQTPKLVSSQNQVDQILRESWKSYDKSDPKYYLAKKLKKLDELSENATKYMRDEDWSLIAMEDNKIQLDATKLLIDLATGKHLAKKSPLIDNSNKSINFTPKSRQ